MGEIKPVGSEKLQGVDKINRIIELSKITPKNNSTKKFELVESTTNGVFVISKEKDGYYVKRGLNENSVDYIGGLFMKNKNRFHSYGDALKRLSLLKGQEELNEAKKYILKQKATQQQSLPQPNLNGVDDEMDDSPVDAPPSMDNQSQDGDKTSNYMTDIQKFSGKLGQSLRDVKESLTSDDIKYVINMILSALDLSKINKEDKDDIILRFETNNKETSTKENPFETNKEVQPSGEDELEETMSKLEKIVNQPIETDEIDLSKYNKKVEDEDEIQEIDLDEIKNEINKSVQTTLSKYFK